MRNLNYQLKQLCRHCREGSYSTQAKRERMLTLMANQLHELGYRGMTARSLKPKHIEALLGHWREQELTTGTIKNRIPLWTGRHRERYRVHADDASSRNPRCAVPG